MNGNPELTVTIAVTADGFAASCAFYEAVLGALGLQRVTELVDEEEDDAIVEAVGWGRPDEPAALWLVVGTTPTSGLHVRLSAKSRVEVETFASVIVSTQGSVHAAPHRWTPFRRGEYGATVRDPAGNLVEAVAPE